jgi:hypothetical protein
VRGCEERPAVAASSVSAKGRSPPSVGDQSPGVRATTAGTVERVIIAVPAAQHSAGRAAESAPPGAGSAAASPSKATFCVQGPASPSSTSQFAACSRSTAIAGARAVVAVGDERGAGRQLAVQRLLQRRTSAPRQPCFSVSSACFLLALESRLSNASVCIVKSLATVGYSPDGVARMRIAATAWRTGKRVAWGLCTGGTYRA